MVNTYKSTQFDPDTPLPKGYQGRSALDEYLYGGGNAYDFNNMRDQALRKIMRENRNYSALNYAPINDKNFSAIYGYSSDPRKRNNLLTTPNSTGNNRPNTYINPSNRLAKPIGTNTGGTASQPNMMNSLLNYAQSPEGRGFAQGLLEASGYTDMPTTLGQAVSQGMKRSNEAKQLAIANQRKDDEISFKKSQALIGNLLAERGLDLQEMKLLQPQLSMFAKDLLAVGIDPMSPRSRIA